MLPPKETLPPINWKGDKTGKFFSGAPTMIILPSGRSKLRYPPRGISGSFVVQMIKSNDLA